MSAWTGHVLRRKQGGHLSVVLVLDLPVLAGGQVAHEIADEALTALTERPALAALLRSAPERGDFQVPS